jgi:cytochrome c-type biogenesis protein
MSTLESVSLLAFAFTAGVFTFFAPCSYPLLPGYLSYYLGEHTPAGAETNANGRMTPGRVTDRVAVGIGAVVPQSKADPVARALVVSLLVSAGFFLVYLLLAGIVAAVGAQVLAGISLLELVVGSLLIVLGGVMATGRKLPTAGISLPERRRSGGSYVGFGVLYAAAAAGCTAPLFIGVALKALTAGIGVGLLAFGAYAGGMSVLMIGVTVATALGREALLERVNRRMDLLHRGAGVLLVLAGLVQIYLFLFRFGGLAMLGLS